MTDSENSQPQDDSDEDIYKDIPEFNFEDELAKLEGSKETYKQEASNLAEKVKVLTEENKELQKSNEILKKNLSTLLKTAQAEVKRKDSLIQELRTQVESFTFRRNKTATKDKYTNTDDLEFNVKVKCEPEKQKSVSDIKRAKSFENRTSSDSERKSIQEEEKWKEALIGKEENINCDIDKNSGYYRRNSKTNSRHSDSSRDRHREKKSSRYEDNSDYRRSYRENHRTHLKSDSYDKKRHSRSSDSRFLSRRRYSRERRPDHRKRGSSERRISDESSERSRRRKERSRSREASLGSSGGKESSLEKRKTLSSIDKDSAVRNREQISTKPEVVDSGKGSDGGDGKKAKAENPEKRSGQDVATKNKQNKDKRSNKSEKRGLDIFSTKSPLDALYNEMVISRNSGRFTTAKTGTTQPDSDIEEGELSVSQPENEHMSPESQPEEDWTLSFKNERKNDPKPMTLYSRRMMRKFFSEIKPVDDPKKKEENEKSVAKAQHSEKIQDAEKEPGELTDDENIVESSKEFQELTKAASIEIELNEQSVKEKTFKEPVRRDSAQLESTKTEPIESQKEVEKPASVREDPNKDVEQKETRDVIEFSPFKNNYKLIEISPIKPPDKEHLLDFYHQRPPPVKPTEQSTLESSEIVTESEKSKQSDTSDEKNSEAELKIVVPVASESRKGKETKSVGKTGKDTRKKKKKTEEKKSKDSKKEEDLGRGKRKPVPKKETEKPTTEDKNQKRKRKCSENDEGKSDAKKRKVEKSEPPRKRSRNKSNSKSESEPVKLEQPKPEPEQDNRVKEDISVVEFFKPAAKVEVPQTPVDLNKSLCTTTDYKMTATMSVTGVVRLETPDKCMEKLKNLMINEHMIFNVLDTKSNSQFSPLIGSKCIEMTPRRMLKNDLMLTDSEDDSVVKQSTGKGEEEEEELEEEEVGEEEDETSGSDNSDCDSDSGASDFVDML